MPEQLKRSHASLDLFKLRSITGSVQSYIIPERIFFHSVRSSGMSAEGESFVSSDVAVVGRQSVVKVCSSFMFLASSWSVVSFSVSGECMSGYGIGGWCLSLPFILYIQIGGTAGKRCRTPFEFYCFIKMIFRPLQI